MLDMKQYNWYKAPEAWDYWKFGRSKAKKGMERASGL